MDGEWRHASWPKDQITEKVIDQKGIKRLIN
jgi:hypothetical protein